MKATEVREEMENAARAAAASNSPRVTNNEARDEVLAEALAAARLAGVRAAGTWLLSSGADHNKAAGGYVLDHAAKIAQEAE